MRFPGSEDCDRRYQRHVDGRHRRRRWSRPTATPSSGPGRDGPIPTTPLCARAAAADRRARRGGVRPAGRPRSEVSDAHADASWRSCATSASTARRSTSSACTARPCSTGRRPLHAPARRRPAHRRALGIDVVNRFRHADVAAGGEGAPLAPLYHQALAASLPQPLMVLNLGGVGNVTYIDGDTVIAFDTGPASALLDDFVLKRRGLQLRRGWTAGRIGHARRRRSSTGSCPIPISTAARRSRSTATTSTPGPPPVEALVGRGWRGDPGGVHRRVRRRRRCGMCRGAPRAGW